MTDRKKLVVGYSTGQKSTDRWFSPSRPYTGNGRTRRRVLDGVTNLFRLSDGGGKRKK